MKQLRKILDNIWYYCWDKPNTWYCQLPTNEFVGLS